MSKKIKRKILNYLVVLEPEKEGGYVAYVPSLPGCITQGETIEEALEMAKDAIKGYLEVLKELKEEIPEENKETIITRINVQV